MVGRLGPEVLPGRGDSPDYLPRASRVAARARSRGSGSGGGGRGKIASRTSNPPRSPMSKADTTGTGVRGRPLTRLRTIDEAAELLNVSPRKVLRLIES